MIAEKNTDVDPKYVYINKFTYFNPEEAQVFNGHPRKGKVYISFYHTYNKHHRLLLPDGVVMCFNVLEGQSSSADFSMTEITLENILDLNIEEEDLDLIIGQPQIAQPVIEDEDFSHRASEIVLGLYQINPLKAEALIQIAAKVMDADLQYDAASYLKYSKTGMSLNIGKTLQLLDRYASDNPKIGGEEEDLLEAADCIVTELSRIYDHDKP